MNLQISAETEVGPSGVETHLLEPEDNNVLGKYVPDDGQVVVERIGYQVGKFVHIL